MKRRFLNILITLVLVLSFSLVANGVWAQFKGDTETNAGNAFEAGTFDLAVNGESPWETQAFSFTGVLPGEELASFPVRFGNIGNSAGNLTFSLSYIESDTDPLAPGGTGVNMTPDEFTSLIYVAKVTHQYFSPTWPQGGNINEDELDNWMAMDIFPTDGYVSLYELNYCSPIPWATAEGDTLPAGEASEFVITFCLGDSLGADNIILIGVEDDDPQGDGISVTISATLVQP